MSRTKGALWIVVIACALVAAVVEGVALERRYRKSSAIARARVDLKVLQLVAETYRERHPDEPCPTFDSLKAHREVPARETGLDPWGMPYRIRCESVPLTVTSYGPDRTEATADDITLAPSATHP